MVRSSGGGKAALPWSVKGVTHTARDLAKDQAGEAGATMGQWLSGVVRRIGAAEASGKALVTTATPPTSTDVVQGESGGPVTAEPIDESELVAMVSERILATEERLVGLLGNLEDIIVSLGDRLERLEARVETESAPPRELDHDPSVDGTDADDQTGSQTRLN